MKDDEFVQVIQQLISLIHEAVIQGDEGQAARHLRLAGQFNLEGLPVQTLVELGDMANELHQIDEAILAGAQFPLTDNQEHCEYCIFRSYCDRAHTTSAVPPGVELETEDLSNTHFDLDMINEIEY